MMRAVHKRYFRELFATMAAYVLLLFCSVWVLPKVDSTPLKAVIALLPMLPLVLAMFAILRVILGQDELERRVDLESIAVGAAVTGLGFSTYALLMSADVLSHIDGSALAFWVLPTLMGTFGLAKCLFLSRYYYGTRE